MIQIQASQRRTSPDAPGLVVDGDEWALDIGYYRPFIEAVTGLSVPEDPSGSDCYRLGNRLEGFVSEQQRNGEWGPEALASYPVVDTPEVVVWLARFFRECQDYCRTPAATC